MVLSSEMEQKMKNVMVCVTQQKTCDRLIKHGYDFLGEDTGELFIIHVAYSELNFLGKKSEGEALEYLYEKALEYGANLTVVKSNNVLDTLVDLIKKNKITHIVLGESGDIQGSNNLLKKLEEKISGRAQLVIIPPS
jgi:K+-sensing histidine kinase KdpD